MSDKVQVGKFQIEKNTPEAAICFLAGNCNGARTHDGQGFGRFDVDFGHSLANGVAKYGRLTEKQHAAVTATKNNGADRNGMIHKYRKQLTAAGFDVEVILDAPLVQQEMELVVPAADPVPAKPDFVLIDAGFRRETDKGLQISHDGRTHWLPKSKIEYAPCGNGLITVKIPSWIADREQIAA